jgi:hypothetical protein
VVRSWWKRGRKEKREEIVAGREWRARAAEPLLPSHSHERIGAEEFGNPGPHFSSHRITISPLFSSWAVHRIGTHLDFLQLSPKHSSSGRVAAESTASCAAHPPPPDRAAARTGRLPRARDEARGGCGRVSATCAPASSLLGRRPLRLLLPFCRRRRRYVVR